MTLLQATSGLLFLLQGRSDLLQITRHLTPATLKQPVAESLVLKPAGGMRRVAPYDAAHPGALALSSLSRQRRTAPQSFGSTPIYDADRSVMTYRLRTAQQNSPNTTDPPTNGQGSKHNSCVLGSKAYSEGESISTGMWCKQKGGCPIGQIAHPLMVCKDGRWVAR
jgi:hypothetical protein